MSDDGPTIHAWPGGKALPDAYGGAWGQQLKPENQRAGVEDDGNVAWEERIVEARRQWMEVPSDAFERIGRFRWRDLASGLEFREAHGAPLLAIGQESTRGISAFFIRGGKLTFLERADLPEETTVRHGPVRGGQIVDGRVHWETS